VGGNWGKRPSLKAHNLVPKVCQSDLPPKLVPICCQNLDLIRSLSAEPSIFIFLCLQCRTMLALCSMLNFRVKCTQSNIQVYVWPVIEVIDGGQKRKNEIGLDRVLSGPTHFWQQNLVWTYICLFVCNFYSFIIWTASVG